MLQNEIDLFNNSLFEWALRWASFYCAKGNQASVDFKNDIELYFPTFFENRPIFDSENRIISFSQLLIKPHFDINETRKEKVSKWKFGRFSKSHYDRSKLFNNFDEIESVFKETSIVSIIFWKHIHKPFEYPIFDQRTMRAFSVLNGTLGNFLWIDGIPSDTEKQYYNDIFRQRIVSATAQELDKRKKLIMLRIIDYALFSFDKLIISKLSKKIPINVTVTELLNKELIKHKLSIDNQKLFVYKMKI